ncbi:membrane protein insertase YidC [Flavilitoribacter nigricans]|uniref:Membrane protein insertase YidC n=1 Tax=Flavilitoribacter nigricans (strain ATCC 23147 / DSM 23189 / NBRC 102662 / NCIMB 1420 / SS-2) TaxID=1122177 RepID=A0A2D0N367_FLAN2|nr:membrane protein insertase YidC [Flavilitoribacter nigricans]PHN02887.1 membrane protein insertase YidC [Flavilitoribacter nigricans DSM 23189 = NBRC 102662]
MDRNTVIGFVLIFLLLVLWQQFNAPTPEQLELEKRRQDSIALAQNQPYAEIDTSIEPTVPIGGDTLQIVNDSLRQAQLSGTFGPFAAAASGDGKVYRLENDLMSVTFNSKGGRITSVMLKNYFKVLEDEKGEQTKVPLKLLEDEKNRFGYYLPMANVPSGGVNTDDLIFTPTVDLNTRQITFRASAGGNRYFEQKYTLREGSYVIDYDIRFEGMDQVLSGNVEKVQLKWLNYLDKIELNTNYERNYSTAYYKPVDDDPDYCSCTSDDIEKLDDQKLKWVSNTNQFFNSSLIAETAFSGALLETEMLDVTNDDLKVLNTQVDIPFGRGSSESFNMDFYVGPNEYALLRAAGPDLEDIIPFGWSIFGTVNRWVIRPIFSFLSSFIGSAGIVILVLTFLVKLALYPLTYKMLYSQNKMAALKPRIEKMKEKYKGDQQQVQMETMKLYREFGVNPLGGCMPMVLQMPIWFALYRFFPASIEFRQASFLWATDLSSYDVIARLPFEIPFFGAHLSLFTLLWAVTTLIYTYYNTKHMDFGSNPAMKYLQYIMPIMFLGFFNSFAAGLTCYLLFSNLFNITQTVVTKNYIINQDKIQEELEAYKKKPKKKKSGFQERLEAAMKEQQRVQAERQAQKGKSGKRK